MTDRLRLLAPLVLVALLGYAFAAEPPVTQNPKAPQSSPSPFSSPIPSVSPSPAPKPNPKQLLKEFQKAQTAQLKAVEHRQKFEMRELQASQAAREREWLQKEQEARHKYFEEQRPKGPEKRAYINDYIKRHEALHQLLKDEHNQRADEQEVRLKALKNDQAARLKEFEDDLKKGEIPPQRLWPDGGY